MHGRSLALFTLAAAALVGCGSDTTSPDNLNSNCSITLSGAMTGTFACTAAAAWASQNDSAAFVITSQTNTPAIIVGIGRRGQWAAGTFTNTTTDALGGVAISTGQSVWVAESAAASGAQAVGSYTLNLTSASSTTVSQGATYLVHGTFDSAAPAVAGSSATGTVTVHAVF